MKWSNKIKGRAVLSWSDDAGKEAEGGELLLHNI